MANENKRAIWVPFESNLSKYIDKLGVRGVECHELWGFEPEQTDFVPGPHLALIFCYPYQEVANAYQNSIYGQLTASGKGIVPEWAFFMKQKIGNACGTFALFHALTNNVSRIDMGNGDFCEWFNKAKGLDVEHRSELLANNEKLTPLHEDCALEEAQTGTSKYPETNVPPRVLYHFISYIEHDGRLFEFDSGQEFPRDCGPSNDKTFLTDAACICKKLMGQLEDYKCNAIALISKNE